ncbi:MAG TPA: ABC transporter ATP-binding protein [Acidimicrobiia bacterium]|nr:ABC transporter ATP-binding protein [Acidimicrobiia bacterium]
MSSDLAIDSTQLTKYYGAQRGVVDLDLDVRAGEVFGFLGPNGAGKSTTIHLLMGQIRPSRGTAAVLGLDCWRDRDAAQRRVGFLPGEFTLYERLTGAEMLAYLARLRGGVSQGVLSGLVDRFAVELDRPIRDLSMGNKQKIGLVQAFMHEPELVILDEPTLGLDPMVQREFQRLLREVRDEGRTVFLSSHTLSEVERVADRVGIIREGTLVEVAEVSRLKQLSVRRIDFEFAVPVPATVFEGVDGVRHVEVEGREAKVEVEGSLARVMKVAADHEVIDLHVREAHLEEIFLAYYGGEQARGEEA